MRLGLNGHAEALANVRTVDGRVFDDERIGGARRGRERRVRAAYVLFGFAEKAREAQDGTEN